MRVSVVQLKAILFAKSKIYIIDKFLSGFYTFGRIQNAENDWRRKKEQKLESKKTKSDSEKEEKALFELISGISHHITQEKALFNFPVMVFSHWNAFDFDFTQAVFPLFSN